MLCHIYVYTHYYYCYHYYYYYYYCTITILIIINIIIIIIIIIIIPSGRQQGTPQHQPQEPEQVFKGWEAGRPAGIYQAG